MRIKIRIGVFICISLFSVNLTNAQSGCTDPVATNYNSSATSNDGSCVYAVTHSSPVLRGALSTAIPESSGLVWTAGKLWTHNDSGNPPDIFSIDTTNGNMLQTVVIDNYPNVDWEDITADNNFIYVGDHGNNSGDRKDLKILKIAKADITSGPIVHVNAQAISFSYTDQTIFASSSTHNFDCEALISVRVSLYIFTKDRGDLKTRVYKMPKIPGTYPLTPYTSFNINGLITGADYDSVTNEVILIGYFSGHTNSFLWILNDFPGDLFFSGNKRRIEIGNGMEWQTEGVAYISPKRFFVSCESAGSINASLFVSNENWLLSASVMNHEVSINNSCFPNPINDIIHINNLQDHDNYAIFSLTGFVIQQGELKKGDNSLSAAFIKAGTYFLETNGKEGKRTVQKIVKH